MSDIPDIAIDLAHRIGGTKVVAGQRYRQVIVTLTTLRLGTQVYGARKKYQNHRIKLDLIHAPSKTIQNVNNRLRPKGSHYFAFVDINCRICAKLGEEFYYFSDENDLTSITSEIETYQKFFRFLSFIILE